MLDDIRRMLNDLPPAPAEPPRLHCGEAIYAWFHDRPAPPVPDPPVAHPPATALTGIPIVLDAEIGRGRWQLRAGAEVLREGQIGDGERVWYAGSVGFVTFDPDALADAVGPIF